MLSFSLMSLNTFSALFRLNISHHLLLRNQMINPLQQPQQPFHTPTPLIQHLVRVSRLRETDYSRRPIDLRVYRFRGDQLRDVRFCLVLVEVQQLRQSPHLDACVVFRHNADVMLDDSLTYVFPASVGFRIVWGGRSGEYIGGAESGAVL